MKFKVHAFRLNLCIYSHFTDEFRNFFSKYGKVVEHQIIRDHETQRSRGFGFIIFDSDEVVDEMLSNGNMIEMAGTQVSLFRWTPSNQHVNQFLFIMEHALLHSPHTFIRYILMLGSELFCKRDSHLSLVTNLRWRFLQV